MSRTREERQGSGFTRCDAVSASMNSIEKKKQQIKQDLGWTKKGDSGYSLLDRDLAGFAGPRPGSRERGVVVRSDPVKQALS